LGEVLDGAAQRDDLLTMHGAVVSGGTFLGQAERGVDVDGRTLAAAAVRDRVARDRVEPGEERLALPAVAVDVRERAREDLAREVLGVAGLANAVQEVAVDAVDVRAVQIGERRTVPTT